MSRMKTRIQESILFAEELLENMRHSAASVSGITESNPREYTAAQREINANKLALVIDLAKLGASLATVVKEEKNDDPTGV